MIVSELRASERMGEGAYRAEGSPDESLRLRGDRLRDLVHASDGRDYPYLVSDADPAVLSPKAAEGRPSAFDGRDRRRLVFVFEHAVEVRFHVVSVDPLARRDRRSRPSYGRAVLYDVLPLGDRAKSELVPPFYIIFQDDAEPFLARLERGQSDRDVVLFVDPQVVHKHLKNPRSSLPRISAPLPVRRP